MHGGITLIEVYNYELPQMATLEKCMKEHPENFDGHFEYSLIDKRPFLKVTRPATVKLEQTSLFGIGDDGDDEKGLKDSNHND